MKKDIAFHVGCSGFYNRHWKGLFYPEKLPQKDWLNYYSGKLNTLELNSTFYKFPTLLVMQNWYKKTPADFIFTVKASRIITHLKKFKDCEQLIADLYNVCKEGLKEKLGCVLFQLPPSIPYSQEMLNLIIRSLDHNFKNVVEFRHKSWWKKKVYDRLNETNITFCTVSHPLLPETLILNNSTAYVRLHGTPEMFYSNYDAGYLNDLHRTILAKKKIQEVYVYFNNTAGNAGILNALALEKLSD